jgi:hypothetical protein
MRQIATFGGMQAKILWISIGALLAVATARAQQPTDSLEMWIEPAVKSLHQQYVAAAKADPTLQGFRVQIYNGSRQEALRYRSRCLQAFPKYKPHTVYESPEYRIQLGDFKTRLEAERFLKRVKQRFPGSFIIRTRINFPKLD